MKKIFTILFLFIFSLQLNSQIKNFDQIKHLKNQNSKIHFDESLFEDEQNISFKNNNLFPQKVQKSKRQCEQKVKPTLISKYGIENTAFEKESYQYDENGNELIRLIEINDNGSWINFKRDTSSYDENGNQITNAYETWHDGKWITEYKYTNQYDEKGNITESLFEENKDDSLKYSFKYFYEYENGRLMNELTLRLKDIIWSPYLFRYFEYDDKGNYKSYYSEFYVDGNWIGDHKSIFEYDEQGRRISYINQRWENGNWINSSGTFYTYDDANLLFFYTYKQWKNEAWVDYNKYSYTLDSDGRELTFIYEITDGVSLKNNSKTIYEYYDLTKELVSLTFQKWNDENWYDFSRIVYQYDGNGNMTTQIEQRPSYLSWDDSLKISYAFDENNNCTNAEAFFYKNSVWEKGYNYFQIFYDNYEGYIYENASKVEVTYKHFSPTSVKDENSQIKDYTLHQNYPNPFNPSTAISYQLSTQSKVELKIFDVLGREIQTLVNEIQSAGNYKVNFDATNLPSGIYIYQIKADNFVQSKKMVLVK